MRHVAGKALAVSLHTGDSVNLPPGKKLRSTERSLNRVIHKKIETCESMYVSIVDRNLPPVLPQKKKNSSGVTNLCC